MASEQDFKKGKTKILIYFITGKNKQTKNDQKESDKIYVPIICDVKIIFC